MPKPVKSPPRASLWEGPDGAGPNGGISYSMLRTFLTDRERFRVRYVLGWRPVEQWNFRTSYGTLFHECERALAAVAPGGDSGWRAALRAKADEFCRLFPFSQEQVRHWENVCAAQFPAYVEYWSTHEHVKTRTPLLQEQVFDVPYALPSGRRVRLRGRWDAVDMIGTGRAAAIYLGESKTKGDVDPELLQRQLTWDLQTQVYLIALGTWQELGNLQNINDVLATNLTPVPIAGVRYNVVRRPLSGGRGSISRYKATEGAKCPKCKGESGNAACPKCGGAGRVGAKPEEPAAEFYARLKAVIAEDPAAFFTRFQVEVLPQDVARFRRECLDPVLEQLWEWYEAVLFCGGEPFRESYNCKDNHGLHYRTPYGIGGPNDDYPPDEIDQFIASGSTVGLERADRLFRELDDDPPQPT